MFGSNTLGFNFDLKYTYDAAHNIKFQNHQLKQKVSTVATAIGVTFEF